MRAALRLEKMRSYRNRLRALLGIPEGATEMQVHSLIMSGFPAQRLLELCELGAILPRERDWIVPPSTLRRRVSAAQRLTVEEGDRLFRVIHTLALAQTIFGRHETARRWLEKPQKLFDGQAPLAMLATTVGMWAVEEMLLHGPARTLELPD